MDDSNLQLDHHRHLSVTSSSFDFIASSTPDPTPTRCCTSAAPSTRLQPYDISHSDPKINPLFMASIPPPQVILVTGCSSGIGRATARYFFARGWLVAASFRNTDCAAASELRPDVAMVVKLDLCDGSSISHAVEQVVNKLGTLDAVVNCGGTALVGAIERCTHTQLTRAMTTNVAGPLSLIATSMPHLRQSRGVAVVVSSALGRAPLPLTAAYCACKAALDAAVQGFAPEGVLVGVRVKTVVPGRVTGTNFIDNAERAGSTADAIYGDMTECALAAMQMDGDVPCSTVKEVAACIWNAVTDGSNKISYIVGEDAKALMAMRNTMTDEQLRDELVARFELK